MDDIKPGTVNTNTIDTRYDELDQLASMLRMTGRDDSHLSAETLRIETEETTLEVTGTYRGSVKVREVNDE